MLCYLVRIGIADVKILIDSMTGYIHGKCVARYIACCFYSVSFLSLESSKDRRRGVMVRDDIY